MADSKRTPAKNVAQAKSQFVPTWDGIFQVVFGKDMLKQAQETKGEDTFFTGPKSIVMSAIAEAERTLSSPEALQQKLQTGASQDAKESLDWSKLPAPGNNVKEAASVFMQLFGNLIHVEDGIKFAPSEIFEESKGARCEGGKLISGNLGKSITSEAYQEMMAKLAMRFKDITKKRFHEALTGGQSLPVVEVDIKQLTEIPFLVYLVGKCIRVMQELDNKGLVASSRLEFDYSYLYQCMSPPKFELMLPIKPSKSPSLSADRKQNDSASPSADEEQVSVRVNRHHLRRSFMQSLKSSYHVQQDAQAIVVDFFDDETAASKKPLCLVEVVDKSGSLSDSENIYTAWQTGKGPFAHIKSDLTRSAELVFSKDMDSGSAAEVCYFFFSTTVSAVRQFNATNKSGIPEFIDEKEASGATELSGAILKALEYIKSRDLHRTHNVILRVKTDGCDNDGQSPFTEAVRKKIAANNKKIAEYIQFFLDEASHDPRIIVPQIRIHAYGDNVNEENLRELHGLTGGLPGSYVKIDMLGQNLGVISQDDLKNSEFRHGRRVFKFVIEPESKDASPIEQTNSVLLTGEVQRLKIHTPFGAAKTVTVNGKPHSMKKPPAPQPRQNSLSIQDGLPEDQKEETADSKASVKTSPAAPLAFVAAPTSVPINSDAALSDLSEDEDALRKLLAKLQAKRGASNSKIDPALVVQLASLLPAATAPQVDRTDPHLPQLAATTALPPVEAKRASAERQPQQQAPTSHQKEPEAAASLPSERVDSHAEHSQPAAASELPAPPQQELESAPSLPSVHVDSHVEHSQPAVALELPASHQHEPGAQDLSQAVVQPNEHQPISIAAQESVAEELPDDVGSFQMHEEESKVIPASNVGQVDASPAQQDSQAVMPAASDPFQEGPEPEFHFDESPAADSQPLAMDPQPVVIVGSSLRSTAAVQSQLQDAKAREPERKAGSHQHASALAVQTSLAVVVPDSKKPNGAMARFLRAVRRKKAGASPGPAQGKKKCVVM